MSQALRGTMAALLLMTCAAAYARADDKDDIKAAGKAFATAMHEGDVAAAKKHVVADEKSSKFLDALLDLTKAKKKLTDAAIAKFGEDGKTIVNRGPGLGGPAQMDHNFDDADIEVTGDTAVVTPKQAQKPIHFKKDGGEWKLDFSMVVDEPQIARGLPVMEKMALAMSETATEINDGKYQTAAEAKNAFHQKIMASLMDGRAPRDPAAPGGAPSK